jgi:hypothetical protein
LTVPETLTSDNILKILLLLLLLLNRALGRIFRPKRDEGKGGWRKLHNEELHSMYSSPSIIRVIKSRRMRWAGHVALMGEKRNAYKIWWESQKVRDH